MTRPIIPVGAACRLLRGTLLYDVTITEARVILDGTPQEFVMYRVKVVDRDHYLDRESIHRSDLFAKDEDRALLDEINERIEDLEWLRGELEQSVVVKEDQDGD